MARIAAARPTAASMVPTPVEVAAPRAGAGAPGPDGAGVFLTPRVIDQGAFERMCAALTSLIDRAAAQVGPLREATAQAERTLGAIREAADQQQSRVERAVAMLESLDARVQHVEAMLVRATDSAAAVRRFEEKTDEVIASRVAQFAGRLDVEVGAAAARAAEVERRAEAAAGALAAKAGRTLESLDVEAQRRAADLRTLCDRARALTQTGAGGLGDVVERGERLVGDAAEATTRLEAVREEAGSAKELLGESLLGAAGEAERLRAEHDRLREALGEAVSLCRAAQGVMGARIDELRAAIEPPVEELRARADGAAESLRAAVTQTESAAADASEMLLAHRTAATQIRALLEELEPWRPLLLGEPADGPRRIPGPIVEIVESLRADLTRHLGRFVEAMEAAQGADR